jgi:O-methyltransferase involved in polyketide biosynthesis
MILITDSMDTNKDFSHVSPSANALLLLKGLTDIPFARAAAELISLPEKYVPDFESKEFFKWIRVVHFEHRYKSIDQLLAGLQIHNILELSSGFSFRGLATALQQEVYYIDTDLPDLIETKRTFIKALEKGRQLKGTLETLPLNAIDEERFKEVVSHFPQGELAVVNEGLLMYLNIEEKKKICNIIRDVLTKRGGCWITADIYVKSGGNLPKLEGNDALDKFLEEHNIEENKFDSFEQAETFFNEQGFVIDKEAEPQYAQLSTIRYMMQSAAPEQLEDMGKRGKVQSTWRLRLK